MRWDRVASSSSSSWSVARERRGLRQSEKIEWHNNTAHREMSVTTKNRQSRCAMMGERNMMLKSDWNKFSAESVCDAISPRASLTQWLFNCQFWLLNSRTSLCREGLRQWLRAAAILASRFESQFFRFAMSNTHWNRAEMERDEWREEKSEWDFFSSLKMWIEFHSAWAAEKSIDFNFLIDCYRLFECKFRLIKIFDIPAWECERWLSSALFFGYLSDVMPFRRWSEECEEWGIVCAVVFKRLDQ